METHVCRSNLFFEIIILRFCARWCGALLAAIGLRLLLLIFPWYVHEFMADYIGQMGFIIIVLLLFYLFGLLFVLGAQINAFFFDHIQPFTSGIGTTLGEFADREQIKLTDDNYRPSEIVTEELNTTQSQKQ